MNLYSVTLNCGGADPLQNHVDFVSGAVWEDQQKLVTAEPDGYIARANRLTKISREFLQSEITDRMAELIVDFLEKVQINKDDRQAITGFPSTVDRFFEALLPEASIVEGRQWIQNR